MLGWEHPLYYSERSIYSALHAAADRLTPAHLSEFRIERALQATPRNGSAKRIKAAADRLNGRVDLWCQWRDLQFFVELKQADMNLVTGDVSKALKQKWADVASQAREMKVEWCEHGVTVGLLCVRPVTKKKWVQDQFSSEDQREKIWDALAGLNPKPSFIGCWTLTQKKWVTEWTDEDDKPVRQVIPFFFFVGHIGLLEP